MGGMWFVGGRLIGSLPSELQPQVPASQPQPSAGWPPWPARLQLFRIGKRVPTVILSQFSSLLLLYDVAGMCSQPLSTVRGRREMCEEGEDKLMGESGRVR